MTFRRPVHLRRRGFLLQETAMAILVITAVIAGASLFLQRVAAQRRTEEFRAWAALEVANVMEDLLSRRWEELTPNPPRIELSAYCQAHLPAPELRIQVAGDSDKAGARRVLVEVVWQDQDGRPGRPARLVAWCHQPVEVQP